MGEHIESTDDAAAESNQQLTPDWLENYLAMLATEKALLSYQQPIEQPISFGVGSWD